MNDAIIFLIAMSPILLGVFYISFGLFLFVLVACLLVAVHFISSGISEKRVEDRRKDLDLLDRLHKKFGGMD